MSQSGIGGFPCSFLDVVVLLGDKGGFVQALGAVPVKLGVGGVRLGAV